MPARFHAGAWKLALVVSLLIGLTSLPGPVPVHALVTGLLNAGFESGTQNGAPQSWTVGPVSDVAVVVGAEGPNQFATYLDKNNGDFAGNIAVTPYRGSLMLRLGTPKNISEKQNRGDNVVSQTFIADRTSLKFAFNLFSWEERGLDLFSFDLQPTQGGTPPRLKGPDPLSLTMPDGSKRGCASLALPCSFSIDVGKQGQFLYTDWKVVEITGLVIGGQYKFSFAVSGTNNEAHATWAYFDNANTPPVAQFTFSSATPVEGLRVHFTDQSFDPDGPGDIVDWLWTLTGEFDPNHAGLETITTGSQNPDFIFPDQGDFKVCLKVTDLAGETGEVCDSPNVGAPTQVAALNVINGGILVKALSVETRAGQPVNLSGRFLDPGVFDTHNKAGTYWTIGGQTVAASVEEDHGVGRVTGTFTPDASSALGVIPGTLRVTDNSGESQTASFSINVLAALNTREPNNAIGSAVNIESGQRIRSSLPTPGDVDYFRIVRPGGVTSWPAGSEVLLTLRDLPVDLDLFGLVSVPGGGSAAGFEWGGFEWGGFEWGGFEWGGFEWGRFAWGGFEWGGFEWGGFEWGGFGPTSLNSSLSPLTFENLPLSLMHFGVPDGQQLNGADVTLAELGLSGSGLSVAGFSVNRGIAEDTVLIRVDVPNTELIALVRGYNGAFSAVPYSLQIEASVPADLETVLGQAGCTGQVLVPGGGTPAPTSSVQVLYDAPGNNKTLFVTQRERMIETFAQPDVASGQARWNTILASLSALSNHADVGGVIISMDSAGYDLWDQNPCSVAKANNVAAHIRGEIVSRLQADPNIQNVVLVGSDSIIPHRRAPNGTQFNERQYFLDSFLKPGSPLFASLWENTNLTDDYYVDLAPTPAAGGEVYIPDRAIGRVVETPEEIGAQAQAFLDSNGVLDLATGLVTGYDFFADGATATASNLNAKGIANKSGSPLINGTWTAAQLQSALLDAPVPNVAAPYAHYTHYAALSANGFTSKIENDFLSSVKIAGADADLGVPGLQPALLRRLLFTMGCHAGLSVPDASSLAADPGIGIDPKLDLPQALARQQAILIASTGYGLGENTGQGGTELLLTIFANQLNDGGRAGEALRQAKISYLSGLSAITEIDVKSSIQTVFYGLPMYKIDTPPAPPSPPPGGPGNLTVLDGASSTTIPYSLTPVTNGDGKYYTSNDGAQVTSGRPVQPKVLKTNITPAGGQPVHGVLVTSGTYTTESPFDPVIATPATEWMANLKELELCVSGLWPSVLTTVNGLDIDPSNAGPELQTLVVVPGSFRCDSGGGGTPVNGTEFLYTSLTVQLNRSNNLTDFKPPEITDVNLTAGANGSVNVLVSASDANTGGSGISRVVVLLTAGGAIQSLDSGPLSGSGPFTVPIPGGVPADTLVDLEVVDGAGNVAHATAKSGGGFRFIPANFGPDQLYAPGVPVHFPVTAPGSDQSTRYFVDFGDGSFESGPVPGTAFSVHHTYEATAPSTVTAKIQVTNEKGGTGNDEVVLTRCADSAGDYGVDPNADLVACSVSTNATSSATAPTSNTAAATTMTIKLRVAGSVALGETIYQYRVKLSTGVSAFQLRYDNGKVTGLPSATASLNASGDELTFTFNLADIGRASGDFILVSFETQAGKPGEPNVGQPDDMPDAGSFGHVIH